METYIVTVKVVLEIEAVDRETAIEMAQDAAWRTRFCSEYKMVSVRETTGFTERQDQRVEVVC